MAFPENSAIFLAEAAIFDPASSEELRGETSALRVFERVPEMERHSDCLRLVPAAGQMVARLTAIFGERRTQPFSPSSDRNEIVCGAPFPMWMAQRRLKCSLLAFEMREARVRCPLFSRREPGTATARDFAIMRDAASGFLPVVISTDEHLELAGGRFRQRPAAVAEGNRAGRALVA